MNVRRTFAAASLSALTLLSSVAPANAADPSCDDAVALQSSVDQARVALTDAQAAFHAANRPLGRLVAAKRHEAKAELAQSHAAMRALRAQLKGKQATETRQAAMMQLRVERHDVAEARNLLTFKRTVLAQVKADRVAARAAVTAARATLQELEATQESCGATTH